MMMIFFFTSKAISLKNRRTKFNLSKYSSIILLLLETFLRYCVERKSLFYMRLKLELVLDCLILI